MEHNRLTTYLGTRPSEDPLPYVSVDLNAHSRLG
jgi:hypothetical protein